ncbi:aminoacyl-tRNA hydrolase [Bartonella sp. DGB2]|uniref:aminoacyl-tRNA hydrolase n=1 Tax=Bartonella sp. DGB2 TaxID=3388426 RepID=UPI00398FD8A7
MFLIAGLGNPGPQYQNNRHNIGFMAVNALYDTYSFSGWSKKFQADIAIGTIERHKILLLKPQTYMNLAGQAVGEALRFYKLTNKDLLVIYDDLDLAPSKTRLKRGGGTGGHNGIKSIDAHCGAQYRRLKLGIGHPGTKDLVHSYVLGDFSKAEKTWLAPLLIDISCHMPLLLDGKESLFSTKLAQKPIESQKRENGLSKKMP